MSRRHNVATTDLHASSVSLREQIAAKMVVAVFVFFKRSAELAGSGQEGKSEGLSVEADDWFDEAGAVGGGVVCHGRQDGLHLGYDGFDFGRGEGVCDFESGHVEAGWWHGPECFTHWLVCPRIESCEYCRDGLTRRHLKQFRLDLGDHRAHFGRRASPENKAVTPVFVVGLVGIFEVC